MVTAMVERHNYNLILDMIDQDFGREHRTSLERRPNDEQLVGPGERGESDRRKWCPTRAQKVVKR